MELGTFPFLPGPGHPCQTETVCCKSMPKPNVAGRQESICAAFLLIEAASADALDAKAGTDLMDAHPVPCELAP